MDLAIGDKIRTTIRNWSPIETLVLALARNYWEWQARALAVKQSNQDVLKAIIHFLGETGEKEAVNIIFDLAMSLPKELWSYLENQFAMFSSTLFSTTLLKRHFKTINDRLDEVLSSEDITIKERGRRLQFKKQSYLSKVD